MKMPIRARTFAGATALGLVLATVPLVGTVHAAETLVGLDVPISIKAREQRVDKFIRELLAQMNIPVQIDERVRGAVNGDFTKPAGQVLNDLEQAFQLAYYYDGATLYVYPASDITRKIMYLPRSTAEQVVRHADELGLVDERNRLEAAEMGLVVTGTTRFREQARELAEAVDSQQGAAVAPITYRVFDLQYGWADDISLVVGGETIVIPGVASTLASLVGSEGVGSPLNPAEAASGAGSRAPKSPTRPKLKGDGLQSINVENQDAVQGGNQGENPIEPLRELTTLPGKGGDAKIVADALHNSVVVRDRADRMAGYEQLIASLDVEPKMVEIEATIIDMNTDRLRELGVDWRVGDDEGEIEGAFGTDGDITPLGSGGNLTTNGDGGIVSLVVGNSTRFLARIRALENQGAARIVSRPHVITLANVEAVLDSTSTFFVRIEGQEEVDLFDVSVGTTLRVTPHVLERTDEQRLKLLVNIEDGSASDQRVDRIPVIENSTINTQALVEEGQSLLIGGLIRENEQSGVSKVPILGDIPIVGGLFRTNSRSAKRTERLFLITPRLVAPAQEAGGGARLDAPILEGKDADIVRTAPLRLESLRAALAERDEEFAVLPPLPRNTADVSLDGASPAGSKAITLERLPEGSARRDTAAEAAPATSPSNERDTLPEDGQSPAIDVSQRRSGIAVETERPEWREDGWQAVPGSSPAR